MSKQRIPISELEKLFHIREDLEFHDIPLIPVYNPNHAGELDDEWGELSDWYLWVVQGDELQRMKGMAAEMYFGKEAASWRDIHSTFFELYIQQARFRDVNTLVDYLLADVRHLSTSIAKIGLFDHLYHSGSFNPDRFVRSEIEFIITTCRSMYETLYDVFYNTWDHLNIPEKQQLPDDFKGILTQSGNAVEADYLTEEYNMPEKLAEFCATEAENFITVRQARDSIIHHGDSVEAIFRGSDGLSVLKNDTILGHFRNAWSDDQINDNNLGPLWPPIAQVIQTTLSALNRYANALSHHVDFADPVSPNHRVFIRGECLHFLPCLEYLIDIDPYGIWIREDVRLRFVERNGLPAEFPIENP